MRARLRPLSDPPLVNGGTFVRRKAVVNRERGGGIFQSRLLWVLYVFAACGIAYYAASTQMIEAVGKPRSDQSAIESSGTNQSSSSERMLAKDSAAAAASAASPAVAADGGPAGGSSPRRRGPLRRVAAWFRALPLRILRLFSRSRPAPAARSPPKDGADARPAGGGGPPRVPKDTAAAAVPPSERTWLQEMVVQLDGLEYGPEGQIPTDQYLRVISAIPPVYEALFSVKMIVGIMKSDITGGVSEVQTAAAEVPDGRGETLQGMVEYHIATSGLEGIRTSKAKGKVSGSLALLWLNRASSFMTGLMHGLAEGKEATVAAADSYDEITICIGSRRGLHMTAGTFSYRYETVLKPYHGFVARNVVGTAMGLCPPMEVILQKLQLPNKEEGIRQMQVRNPPCTAMEPQSHRRATLATSCPGPEPGPSNPSRRSCAAWCRSPTRPSRW
jgi:hypothetical protein